MADLNRIKSNVAKMASMKAPEEDIDGYIASEGVTVNDVRSFQPNRTAIMPKFSTSANMDDLTTVTPTDIVTGMAPRKAVGGVLEGLTNRLKNTIGTEKMTKPIMPEAVRRGILPITPANIGARMAGGITRGQALNTLIDTAASPESYGGLELARPGIVEKPLQSLSKITSGVIKKPLQGIKSAGSFVTGKGLPQQAEIVADELENMRGLFGSAKAEAIEKVANIPIKNVKTLSKELTDLGISNETSVRLKDPLYRIEFLPDGSIKPTVGNMDKVARALGDMLSPSEWDKFSNMSKTVIKRAYGKVRESITTTAPETKGSVDAFHHFLDNIYNPVIRKVQQGGRLVEKPLRDALSMGAENVTKKAISGAGEISPALKSAINYMKNYRRTMAVVKSAGGLGILGGGYKAIRH